MYKNKIAFLNVIVNILVDCDFDGNAKPPLCIKDIGILSSLDPVALDQTCLSLIYNSDDRGIIGNLRTRV